MFRAISSLLVYLVSGLMFLASGYLTGKSERDRLREELSNVTSSYEQAASWERKYNEAKAFISASPIPDPVRVYVSSEVCNSSTSMADGGDSSESPSKNKLISDFERESREFIQINLPENTVKKLEIMAESFEQQYLACSYRLRALQEHLR